MPGNVSAGSPADPQGERVPIRDERLPSCRAERAPSYSPARGGKKGGCHSAPAKNLNLRPTKVLQSHQAAQPWPTQPLRCFALLSMTDAHPFILPQAAQPAGTLMQKPLEIGERTLADQ